MSKKRTQKVEVPAYDVLKQIRDGALSLECLSKESRELCVEALLLEGYSSGQIASLLKKSDRTIRRIVADIRKKNALEASPEFVRIIVGDMVSTARAQSARLKQIARSAGIEAFDRAQMEFLAWRVYKEVVEKLHKIGYLSESLIANSIQEKKDFTEDMSDEDLAIQKVYSQMSLMDRHRLIDKLHKDIVTIDENNERENQES